MRIDTRGVELTPPAEWVSEKGVYVFKITKREQDGYSQEGYEKFKFTFQTADGKMFSELFSEAPNMLWKIKQLAVALDAPEVFDPDDFVGHYVTADIRMKKSKKDGEYYPNVWQWMEAPQNKKVDPIPSAAEDVPVEIDIDDDEIPF